jgi:alkylation response protein AidB-like acyl-CoA dehydrogenase
MSLATAPVAIPLSPSDEELAIREAVREICAPFGERYARACFERGEPPRELWSALAEKGFTAANIPAEWGGAGLGMTGLIAVAEEVAASGPPLLLLVVTSAIAGSILARHGTDEQNDRWLRGIAAGTMKVGFAITEPDAGTNSHNLRTELRRDGDGYRLSGQKVFISMLEDVDAVLVVARLRSEDGGLGAPCLCLVDIDAPGFTRDRIAMQYVGPESQWQVFFEDVRVDADRLVGGEHGGLAAVFDGLNPERIIAGAMACGTATRALGKATAYARERTVWKTPIGAHQAVAHPLARAKVELELARLMTQKAAALFDAGMPSAGEVSNIAKYAAAEAAIHCVDAAIQTHGGNGFTLEYGVSDLWWSARVLRTAPISAEMVLNHIAQHMLGLPRSY